MATGVSVAVSGVKKLVSQLRARAAKARTDFGARVAVGYSASYAARVHEDLEAYHRTGQAKFLEQPARTLTKKLSAVVVEQLARKRTFGQAALTAGLLLQRESQKLCPVNTGHLRSSAFTRLE